MTTGAPTSFLSLNGVRVVSGHVSIPYYGTWTADVMMPEAPGYILNPGTSVTLTLGNLSLQGAVYRSGPFSGQMKLRIVGGYGGWQKTVPSQQYVLSGGVLLSTVLGDLAAAVGEKVNVQNDQALGSIFVRESAPASRILRQIAGPLWYVDTKGVTQITNARPSKAVSSAFLVNRWDGDRGEFEVSTEDYASWMPGNTFSNEVVTTTQTISLATIDTDNKGTLRFTILTVGPPTDRLIDDIRALIREEIETFTFTGVYEYAVQATDGTTVDAQPTSTSLPLPSLRKVPLRTGIPGTSVSPSSGSLLAVGFLNGDPTRPIVFGVFDGTTAQSVAFQNGNLPAARGGSNGPIPLGDSVVAGYVVLDGTTGKPSPAFDSDWNSQAPIYPGTALGFVDAQTAAASMMPTPGTVFTIVGSITGGSSSVTIG